MAESLHSETKISNLKRIRDDNEQPSNSDSCLKETTSDAPPSQPNKRSKDNIEDCTNDEQASSSNEPNGQGDVAVNGDHPGDGDDNRSDISDLSDFEMDSEHRWTGAAGPMAWVHQQMLLGRDPRTVLTQLIPANAVIPDDIDDLTLWKIVVEIMSDPPKRKKLDNINTLDDVVDLLRTCKKIMILTGAGVSVSCGIPDFRSRDGIYARLAEEYPDLPDPQAMFAIDYFRNNQKPFFKFAKEIYPGQFEPSPSHQFISLLEKNGQLLRNYTQNIDTLEQVAGITKVIQCHGSFATATCMVCKHKVNSEAVKEDIMNQVIPRCPNCPAEEPLGIMKPDIVFFGESLPEEFHNQMEKDKEDCDLLIVIGSSLKVRPVALIPHSIPASVPQILINREPLRNLNFDVELLGDCDGIISELSHRLQGTFSKLALSNGPSTQILREELETPELSPAHHQKVLQDSPDSSESGIKQASTTEPEDSNQNKSNLNQCNPTSQEMNMETEATSKKEDSTQKADSSTQNDIGTSDDHEMRNASDETAVRTVQDIQHMWKPRCINLGSRINEGTFLFIPQNRYVFKGAELIENLDDTDSSSTENSDCSELNDLDEQCNSETSDSKLNLTGSAVDFSSSQQNDTDKKNTSQPEEHVPDKFNADS